MLWSPLLLSVRHCDNTFGDHQDQVETILRIYQTEADYWRIRDFLREVFLQNDCHPSCWPVARLDYWRWHGITNLSHGSLETGVFLWENNDGQIVAVLNQEEPGQVFLQVHPAHKTEDLEQQMIILAEEHLRVPSRRGGMVIWIWSDSADKMRQAILQGHGYTHRTDADEHEWLRDLELPVPVKPARDRYVIRSLGDIFELPARSWASWRAFHSEEPEENYVVDWTWYQNIQKAPLYWRDLDLVAIAPAGEVASFTTIWYDEVTRSGLFEPVGTMPEHQRLGLASALLAYGMQRLRVLGATLAMVSGGSLPANALYRSVFGPMYDIYQPWEKRWASQNG